MTEEMRAIKKAIREALNNRQITLEPYMPYSALTGTAAKPRCQAVNSYGMQCGNSAKDVGGRCRYHAETQQGTIFICCCGNEHDSITGLYAHRQFCIFNKEQRQDWLRILVRLVMHDMEQGEGKEWWVDDYLLATSWYIAATKLATSRPKGGLYPNPSDLWHYPTSYYSTSLLREYRIIERRNQWRDFKHFSRWALDKIDYYDYIESDGWREKADRAKLRAGMRCQLCNRYGTLNAHHRTYERLGNELEEDLIVLCRDCHKMFHANRKVAS